MSDETFSPETVRRLFLTTIVRRCAEVTYGAVFRAVNFARPDLWAFDGSVDLKEVYRIAADVLRHMADNLDKQPPPPPPTPGEPR